MGLPGNLVRRQFYHFKEGTFGNSNPLEWKAQVNISDLEVEAEAVGSRLFQMKQKRKGSF
jgi:hypothetical protein